MNGCAGRWGSLRGEGHKAPGWRQQDTPGCGDEQNGRPLPTRNLRGTRDTAARCTSHSCCCCSSRCFRSRIRNPWSPSSPAAGRSRSGSERPGSVWLRGSGQSRRGLPSSSSSLGTHSGGKAHGRRPAAREASPLWTAGPARSRDWMVDRSLWRETWRFSGFLPFLWSAACPPRRCRTARECSGRTVFWGRPFSPRCCQLGRCGSSPTRRLPGFSPRNRSWRWRAARRPRRAEAAPLSPGDSTYTCGHKCTFFLGKKNKAVLCLPQRQRATTKAANSVNITASQIFKWQQTLMM